MPKTAPNSSTPIWKTCDKRNVPLLPSQLSHGVLLAVSGGVDSTAMFHGCVQAAENRTDSLAVGHVNHGLRGDESDADAVFVRKLAERHRIRYVEHRIQPEEWTLDKSGSVEAAARRIRYDFLTNTAEKLGFRYVAVAHTADDQAETVLHRILRGTGLDGIAGMSAARPLSDAVTLVRPLLKVFRNELIEFLQQIGESYRTDSTNATDTFTRNKIRNKLLPLLRAEFNPKIDEALLRLARIAKESDETLNAVLDSVLPQPDDPTNIDASVLLQPKSLVRAFFRRLWKERGLPLRKMGFDQWNELAEFLLQGDGRRLFPDGISVERNGERISVHFS